MVLLRGPFFGLLLTAFSAISSAQTFQAEAGTLIGVSTSTSVSGYSGSGFVTGFDAAGDKVIVWPWITTAGSYTLTVRYRASTGEKRANVIVNDVVVKEISLPACTGWCNADAGSITLGTGKFCII